MPNGITKTRKRTKPRKEARAVHPALLSCFRTFVFLRDLHGPPPYPSGVAPMSCLLALFLALAFAIRRLSMPTSRWTSRARRRPPRPRPARRASRTRTAPSVTAGYAYNTAITAAMLAFMSVSSAEPGTASPKRLEGRFMVAAHGNRRLHRQGRGRQHVLSAARPRSPSASLWPDWRRRARRPSSTSTCSSAARTTRGAGVTKRSRPGPTSP